MVLFIIILSRIHGRLNQHYKHPQYLHHPPSLCSSPQHAGQVLLNRSRKFYTTSSPISITLLAAALYVCPSIRSIHLPRMTISVQTIYRRINYGKCDHNWSERGVIQNGTSIDKSCITHNIPSAIHFTRIGVNLLRPLSLAVAFYRGMGSHDDDVCFVIGACHRTIKLGHRHSFHTYYDQTMDG